MKNKIINTLNSLKAWLESDEMCYMAINGGFEFEIKNKLAYWLQHNYNENNSIFFVKEAKIGKDNKSKIVDIISILPNKSVENDDLFYIDGEKKNNKVGCAIELGHNYLSQPVDFIINKTNTDITKCHNAGITNNLYIVQIVTNIVSIDNSARYFFKRSYLSGVKSHIKNNKSLTNLSKIRDYYNTIDNQYKELSFKNKWNNFETEIYLLILKI